MYYSLGVLFELLDRDEGEAGFTLRGVEPFTEGCAAQQGLFAEPGAEEPQVSARDAAIVAGLYSSEGPDLSALPPAGRRLFELSVNAFDAFAHAWMSELPIEGETVRFGRKVLVAARRERPEAERAAADRAASDRGDPDTRTVLETACKVCREIDRLRGLLRFNPDNEGVYIARCAPDHFILPALCEHFTRRFGDTSWIIIDEKRRLRLCRLNGQVPELSGISPPELSRPPAAPSAEWEKLWRHYHKTINNESRNNPDLQRQFMPNRYRKYLNEL
jgi:probable DNA metabolism protein